MSLFFVPAIMSIFHFQALLLQHWFAMLLAIIVATLVAFLITLFIAKLTIGGGNK